MFLLNQFRAPRLTTTISIAEIWKPPDIGQIYSESDDGEQEISVTAPGLSPVVSFGAAYHRLVASTLLH